MNNLEKQLNKETLHQKNSKSNLSVIKVQFDKFLHSEELKPSNYDGRHVRETFKDYTRMEAQSFKDLIIQHIDSIEQCIVERALHEQKIQKRMKRLNDRKLQIQECKLQELKATDASSGDTYISGFVLDNGNIHKLMAEVSNSANYNVFAIEKQHTKQPEFINDTCVMKTNDSNVTYDSSDMSHNVSKVDQHAVEPEDERMMLASLIANFKLNIDENKKSQK
ncbi:hypothetical protein Tco_1200402 [Tanacetum coccineum]